MTRHPRSHSLLVRRSDTFPARSRRFPALRDIFIILRVETLRRAFSRSHAHAPWDFENRTHAPWDFENHTHAPWDFENRAYAVGF